MWCRGFGGRFFPTFFAVKEAKPFNRKEKRKRKSPQGVFNFARLIWSRRGHAESRSAGRREHLHPITPKTGGMGTSTDVRTCFLFRWSGIALPKRSFAPLGGRGVRPPRESCCAFVR